MTGVIERLRERDKAMLEHEPDGTLYGEAADMIEFLIEIAKPIQKSFDMPQTYWVCSLCSRESDNVKDIEHHHECPYEKIQHRLHHSIKRD